MICKRLTEIATVVVLAAGLSGCNDDGATEMTRDDALSKEEYVERANALCAELATETKKLAEESFEGLERQPTEEELRDYQRRATELQRNTLVDLRALWPPEGDEAPVAAIYDELERVLDELEAVPAASPGQPGDVSLGRFQELANDYGLTECAQG